MTDNPHARLWELMRGFMATQALYVAARLEVADQLGEGPRPVADIARQAGADPDALHRFLRALAGEGVFAEDEPGVFRNTPASELLRRESSWHHSALLFGTVWYRTFAKALDAVRSGEPTFPRLFGTDWWSWLAENPEEGERFNRMMQGERKADLLAEVDWRDDETVVDIGGGNGQLLIDLLGSRPDLRGVVFELPEVAREAEERVAEAGLSRRCRVVAGSFFDGVPEGGDTYVLSTVLHDWDDEAAGAILRNVRAAAPDHARVLIVDAVIEPGNEPDGEKWLDLLMLVLLGGRERTEDEWRALLAGAGFRLERVEPVLEAVPA
jgi:O-methyltransferase/methyltransferase family protein